MSGATNGNLYIDDELIRPANAAIDGRIADPVQRFSILKRMKGYLDYNSFEVFQAIKLCEEELQRIGGDGD